MSRIFIDGFEAASHDMWDAESNATVVSSAGFDMDGDYCLDLNSSAEYLQKNITADDEMYFAFLYRPTDLTMAEGIISLWNGGTRLIWVGRMNGGTLNVYTGAFTILVEGTKTFSVDTTYLIEFHIKIADSGGRAEVKVDGIQDIDFTGDTKPDANTQFDKVRLGHIGTTAAYSYAYFDNFIMDDAAWIGDSNIQAIVPTAGGNSTGWTPSAGSNFACVDEIPPSDTDYVSINANDVSDTYVTGDLTGSIDNIKCIQIQARARLEGAPTPTNLKLVVRCGATDYLSGDKAVPAAESGLYNLWATDPSDAAVWTESDVNAIEIGVKSAA